MTSYNSYGVTRFDQKQAGYGSIADVLGDIELMNTETGEIILDIYGGLFVSYSSIIFFYVRNFNSNTIYIYKTERWKYSPTTSKQTTQFMNRFFRGWHIEIKSGTYEYRLKGRNYWNYY